MADVAVWSLFADTKGDLALTKATEMKYGLDIIAECEKANIKHVVFSGLYASFEVKDDMISTTSYEREPLFSPPSQGVCTLSNSCSCLSFRRIDLSRRGGDADITVQAHLRKSKLPWTIYYSSAYWENLHHLGMIQVQDDGSIKINLMSPDSLKQQFTSIRQVGPFVKTIFDHPEKYMGELARRCIIYQISRPTDIYAGKEVFNNTEEATWGSFATRLAAMSGKKVFTPQITEQEWSSPETKARLFPYYSVLDSLYTT